MSVVIMDDGGTAVSLISMAGGDSGGGDIMAYDMEVTGASCADGIMDIGGAAITPKLVDMIGYRS